MRGAHLLVVGALSAGGLRRGYSLLQGRLGVPPDEIGLPRVVQRRVVQAGALAAARVLAGEGRALGRGQRGPGRGLAPRGELLQAGGGFDRNGDVDGRGFGRGRGLLLGGRFRWRGWGIVLQWGER